MLKCIVFDFDGTLVLSNDIKRRGFYVATQEIPDSQAIVGKLLESINGDRNEILLQFSSLTNAEPCKLIKKYNSWVAAQILRAPSRTGSDKLLLRLKQLNLKLYINSATPIGNLRPIIRQRYEKNLFSGVFGNFGDKSLNLDLIMKAERCSAKQVVVIGDGVDDYEAAERTGCHWFAVESASLQAAYPDMSCVSNLMDICESVEKLSVV